MTCHLVLETLLDAEPSELAADGMTPLGQHLRECARCRRVAAQLLHDTARLSIAMQRAPARRPARRPLQRSLTPAFVVGAIVFAVVLRGARPAETPVVEQVRPDDRPAPVSTPALPLPPNAVVTPPARAPRARLGVMRAFPRPVPVTPVKLERVDPPVPAEMAVATGGLSVDPPPGTRAAVLHTSNPKLVVVWLY